MLFLFAHIWVFEFGGLWKTPEAVDEGLEKLMSGKRGDQWVKLEAVRTQISFHKKNIRRPIPAKMGSFLQAGKAFSLKELKKRLIDILQLEQLSKEWRHEISPVLLSHSRICLYHSARCTPLHTPFTSYHFRCVLASLYTGVSVLHLVSLLVQLSVIRFLLHCS